MSGAQHPANIACWISVNHPGDLIRGSSLMTTIRPALHT